MGHFGAMNEIRDVGGREVSGAGGVYDEEISRPLLQMPHIAHGPNSTPHFSSSGSHSIHDLSTGQGSSGIQDRIKDGEGMNVERDKNAIYK